MATADGSILIRTKVDNSGIKQGTASIQNGIKGLNSSLLKLGATMGLVFGVAQLIQFGKQAVKTASEMTNAYIGLKSIVEGTGNSFEQANAFIQSYISDGLVPATEAVTAYKNLLMRGYSTEQIEKVMTALKDSASFGRQASLTLGGAVASATEGLKNENSILVDNAGVTKNVSMMWKDYAESIGTTANALTKEQKIQAEVNGIMEETRFQTGDAAKVANTWSGQISALNVKWTQFMAIIGNGIITALTPFVKALNNILTVAIEVGNAMASVFGWQSLSDQTSTSIASNTADTATSADSITDSTNATNKALKKQVGFFGDINVLNKNTANSVSGGSSTTTTTSGGGSGAVDTTNKFTKGLEKLKPFVDEVKNLTDAIKKFLGKVADGFIQFFKDLFPNVNISTITETIGKFATFIDDIDPNTVERIGGALAALSVSILLFKAGTTTATTIATLLANLNTLASIGTLAMIITVGVEFSKDYKEWKDNIEKYGWDAGRALTAEQNSANPYNGNREDKNILSGILGKRDENDAKIKAWAVETWSSFKQSLSELWTNISDWYNNTALVEFQNSNKKALAEFAKNISDWWDNTVAPWFTIEKWKELGDNVGKGIKDGFNNALISVITFLNEIIGGFETLVNNAIVGLNKMISIANKLPGVKVDLANPVNLSRIQIPKLAQGAVIPANSEFMAILGDQKSGTNIEAPLETIKQAVREVLGSGTSGNGQTVVFQVDGQTFARITLPSTLNEMNRQGYDVAVLGV